MDKTGMYEAGILARKKLYVGSRTLDFKFRAASTYHKLYRAYDSGKLFTIAVKFGY